MLRGGLKEYKVVGPPHRSVYVLVRNAAQTFVDAAGFALILGMSISRVDHEILENRHFEVATYERRRSAERACDWSGG
jgi:hypothetical protein